MDDYEMHNFLRMTVVNRKAFFFVALVRFSERMGNC